MGKITIVRDNGDKPIEVAFTLPLISVEDMNTTLTVVHTGDSQRKEDVWVSKLGNGTFLVVNP